MQCYWLLITDSGIYWLPVTDSVMLLVTYYIQCNVSGYLLQTVQGQTPACGRVASCTSCTMSSRGTWAASPSTSWMLSLYSRGRGCSWRPIYLMLTCQEVSLQDYLYHLACNSLLVWRYLYNLTCNTLPVIAYLSLLLCLYFLSKVWSTPFYLSMVTIQFTL